MFPLKDSEDPHKKTTIKYFVALTHLVYVLDKTEGIIEETVGSSVK